MREEIKPDQWRIFFASLEKAESISIACRKSRIPRATAYWSKANVGWIKERWEEALAAGVDYLKDAALERAVDGVTSTHQIYDRNGKLVSEYTETKYSDRLLLALLASRDPSFRQSSADQVQQRLVQELTRMLDLFQKRLAPDVYQQIIDVLATSDDFNQVGTEAPRYLTDGESDPTRI